MNISAVVNSALDSGVPLGREILAFVDAAVLSDRQELPPARAELFERTLPTGQDQHRPDLMRGVDVDRAAATTVWT